MRLVIDCFKLIKGAGKSIGIYNVACGIVRHLGALRLVGESPRDAELIVLGNKYNREDFDVPGVSFVEITDYDPNNRTHFVLWELFHVSRVCKRLKADRVFFPRGYTALTHPVHDIVLIHDLIPFYYDEHFPGVFNRLENAYIMNRLRASARSAGKVITISQASKRDIVKYCGVDEGKITVINNACEPIAVDAAKDDGAAPYICAITSGLPHKNAKGIIAAYTEYCGMTDRPLNLVVIGLQDTFAFDLPEDIRERITCHKFIKDNAQMYTIIAGSEAFLFLSLVEGFGLPPIEAMQLGVPVICSNTSSLPEVVGDAAVLVDPNDPAAAAAALDDLLRDRERRDWLVRKGYENIDRFSPQSRAREYWAELVKNP